MYQPPFRWNIQKRNELGRLLDGPAAETYPAFLDDLLPCCARILAFAGDSDLFFVGRSPESIFDHLSGLLLDSSWADRPRLLQFSIRHWRYYAYAEPALMRKEQEQEAWAALRAYLTSLGLQPEDLARRERPVALVDLVDTGGTFMNLVTLLHEWAQENKADWEAVKRKVRIVGITPREKQGPNVWRWQQHADWLALLARGAVKNVSIPLHFWQYLAGGQDKVTESYTPWRWASTEAAQPSYADEHLRALRLAVRLFDLGRTRARRAAFARLLAQEPAMSHPWFRTLALELR
ncbi:MAG TPA: hypothetical protein VKT82_24780 [Ktedonobacterales bacterium]|nr:hypothetical protein [Ktedonobacterales bacterium]